jgi:hypothetical protein
MWKEKNATIKKEDRSNQSDNIRMNLREIGREVMDWMHLAQYRDQWRDLMKMVMNLRVP